MIRFAPFSVEELPKTSRKQVRQGLKKCTIQRINALENKDSLYLVYVSAFGRYHNADNQKGYDEFCRDLVRSEVDGCDFWGDMIMKLANWLAI